MDIGDFIFTEPWVLGFLAALPVLWWLLRLNPTAPTKIPFPALMLLRDLATTEQTPARTPWWLLLLRLFIAALIIAAFARPLLNPQPLVPGVGAVLIAVDNDWAAARAWNARQTALHHAIEQAENEQRNVILLPTAPPANGEPLRILGPVAAKAAYALAAQIVPMPWPANWKEARQQLDKIDRDQIAYSLWLNSGLGGKDAEAFWDGLKNNSSVVDARVLSDPETPIYILKPPENSADGNLYSVLRLQTEPPASVVVTARSPDGHALAHTSVNFIAGAPQAPVKLDLPLDIHNQMARFDVDDAHTAAATVLLDEDWQHPAVGIVGDKAEEAEHSFLSGIFYVDRALKPFAAIHIGRLGKLLAEDMSVIVITDADQPNDDDLAQLSAWVKKGGVLVRFAGERLAATTNPHESELLPVSLRTGDRAMGGTMSWAAPQKLKAFPRTSPFQGLDIPTDIAINRQVLAEPAIDLPQKTWAALEDGTPLVTAKNIGNGLSILFHVPARSEWSNLPLSGLFVDMLRRIIALGHSGKAGEIDFSSLAPQRVLDGFGELQAPGPAVRILDNSIFEHVDIAPQYPPGYYGSEGFERALNLGSHLALPELFKNKTAESYNFKTGETDLAPYLLVAALALFLLDFMLSLRLRGLTGLRSPNTVKVAVAAILLAWPAQAADNDKAAIELTSKTYLAYVETGNREVDRVSEAGLNGLARLLQRRTSLDQVGVAGVNPATDELVFFPLLYWPLTPTAQPLPPSAARRVNDYLRHGGMILFDGGADENSVAPAVMQRVLKDIDIPPLQHIPENHVLRRSFYLLDEFPGRNAGGDLWVEPENMAYFDGVAAVIAGTGDWAGAWAIDDNGRALFPCTPGGEVQREYAYRFGVNVVMYALTGNYKSDQLHAQALLERMGK